MAAINKVIYGGRTLIDLTGDSVTEETLLVGIIAHDKSGKEIEGTCAFDSDTSEDTVSASEILLDKTAHARGKMVTGTMPNNGAVNETIDTVDESFTIPQGYHDGSGKVSIGDTDKAKLIAENIKEGVTILGVLGTLEPSSSVTAQPKIVIPSTTEQTILPDAGYDYLSEVHVSAIPYVETTNSAGGITVTIAG